MRLTDFDHYTDEDLLSLLSSENQLAYTVIYQRYWGVMYSHAFKVLGNSDIARDIVQDVFADLWTKAKDIEVTVSLKSYLYGMIRYKALDVIRRDLRQEKHLESLSIFADKFDFDTDEKVIFNEFLRRVDEEVGFLPARMQEVFKMSRFDGMTNKEIAETLDISPHTVKKTITRVLKILKSKLLFLLLFVCC